MSDFLVKPKKKGKKFKIASFDVETADTDNNFYMVGLYYDGRYEAFYDVDSFYNFIRTRLRDYMLVATNLGFDLTSCFLNTKYWNEFEIISNGGYMLMGTNNILGIKFIDTLNWHKASVKELGRIVKMPKLPSPLYLGKRVPQTPMEEKELRDYNKRDCEISYFFSLWFQEQILTLGGELKITIASTSLDVWKRKFNDYFLVKENKVMTKRGFDVDIKEKIFKAYYGGRTEVLQRGHFTNLNYYDFNSLYPSVMIDALPLPNSVQYKETGSITDIYTREGISHVELEHVTDELPLLPYRHNDKLCFPTGVLKGWWTHIEIRTALKHGYILRKVFETVSYTRTFKPFTKYINTLYAKRKLAKKKGGSEQLIYKLLMNSLYGKFGERKHNVTKHFDMNTISKKDLDKIKEEHADKTFTISDEGKAYFSFEEECNASHVFPILPVYITALARIKLWKVARLHNPVYMDTDSIITKDVLPFGKELGELDYEHHIDEGIFIKPKMYFFKDGEETVVRMKGVPRATKQQFLDVISGDKVSYMKFVKLKEGIRRNLKVNSVYEMDKLMSLEDNKRIWEGEFSLQSQTSKAITIKKEVLENRLQNESITSSGRNTTCQMRSL